MCCSDKQTPNGILFRSQSTNQRDHSKYLGTKIIDVGTHGQKGISIF